MNARDRLDQCMRLYVLKQHRGDVWQAIAEYIKERDQPLEYFIPEQVGPFKTEWRRVEQ